MTTDWSYRVDERSLNLVEHNDADGEEDGGESGAVAQARPRKRPCAEHPILERLKDARKRIEGHDHAKLGTADCAKRVDHRRRIHPQLNHEG